MKPQLQITTDHIVYYGDESDGVIEFVGKGAAGHFEAGYFFGEDKEKNIINISSQAGCPLDCAMCDAGPFQGNLTPQEMYDQVILLQYLAVNHGVFRTDHKISIAKTGEPFLNPQLHIALEQMAEMGYPFKISTILPKGSKRNFSRVMKFAQNYDPITQLQISLVSTSEEYRKKNLKGALSLKDIHAMTKKWLKKIPDRRVNLSLIVSKENPCNPQDIIGLFSPEEYHLRLRPYVTTASGQANGLTELTAQELFRAQDSFRAHGYDIDDHPLPTPTERRFGLAANVTLNRYRRMIGEK